MSKQALKLPEVGSAQRYSIDIFATDVKETAVDAAALTFRLL